MVDAEALALSPLMAFAVIAGMALVTFLTRIVGAILMAYVPITPRIENALEALSGSVLVAIVAPTAMAGDWPVRAAILAALLVAVVTGRMLVAMSVAIAVAVILRAVGI